MKLNISKNSLNLAKKALIINIAFAMILSVFAPIQPILAVEPLVITSLDITSTDKNATIEWRTNRKTTGKVEYSLQPGNYTWSVSTNLNKDNHAITISGLFPNTKYFVRITAEDNLSVVQSTQRVFETSNAQDNKAPIISKVSVAYLTGSTATIQWETNENATSEVHYGLTNGYGKVKTSSSKKRIHDITLTGLVDATTYQFRVQSKDKDNNTARWFNMSFRTKFGTKLDNDELLIYNITPISENDINVGETSAVIAWRTNKLSEGWIRYSTNPTPRTIIRTSPPRDFTQNITLTNLTPGTIYYFDVIAKDVFGRQVSSKVFSFQTKSSTVTNPVGRPSTGPIFTSPTRNPQVLGASICSINLATDFGYYGAYYNHSPNHPDFGLPVAQGINWTKVATENDWYNSEYFTFDRVDSKINFTSFPRLNNGLLDDPYYLAVNWRAIIDVPADGIYSYTISSDDDSWLFIDDVLVHNLGGLRRSIPESANISLSAGYHKFEIYYADRRKSSMHVSFKPDTRLKFHPLPLGCEVQDVIDFNNGNNQGIILGVSNEDDLGYDYGNPFIYDNGSTFQPTYACNPDLGYTKIKALYKTTASPDIWAILETGQKHYITSPKSFNLYQCNWSSVQTVSKSFLNSFTNATLVRTPTQPTIYHLFDRPIIKWLKVNIPSPTIFISYEDNFWGNVARINHLDLAAYPDVQLITGENDNTIYLIEGNAKRPFSSPSVFTTKGYDWIEITTLNQPHLDSYVTNTAID